MGLLLSLVNEVLSEVLTPLHSYFNPPGQLCAPTLVTD